MALRHPLFVSGPSGGVTAPQDARLAMASLLSGVGILTGGTVTGSTSGPNMIYSVAAGSFVTARGVVATDGVYVVPNDGPVTVDSGAPSPTSGTRWDLIWVRCLNAFDGGFGDANSDPVFGVTVGTAGATPTKPYSSVPAGALVLAESNVGTNIASASLATISMVAASSAPGFLPAAARVTNSSTTVTVGTTALAVTSYSSGALWTPTGGITYSGGIFTAGVAGLYEWHATVLWPAASASYRVAQYVLVNGTADTGGQASMNFASGYGAQWLSNSHPVQLAAGGTVQLGLVGSTNGIANTQPLSFALHRIG